MPPIETVRDQIAWSYANLARAHAALSEGCPRYTRTHHIIRSRLFKGLISGRMSMRSLYDDERLKMTLPQICAYCGSRNKLSLDHLLPRCKGGQDKGDNLVWACRSCNSSKNDQDMLRWMLDRGMFPSIYVLRRYLKIVSERCEALGLLDERLTDVVNSNLCPFPLELLPLSFPPLEQLSLWIAPTDDNSKMTS